MAFEEIVNALKARFEGISASQFRDNYRVIVKPSQVFDVLKSFKEDHGFDMLAELTAADYLKYPEARDRFGVIYGLLNVTTGERIWVKTFVNPPEPTLPSA